MGASELELDRQLLDAKLTAPRLTRRSPVSRAPLVAAARSSARRIVAVTAPAGYGKSTLMAQWASTEARPVAWVSLDRFDDDPIALLVVLAEAYGRIMPGAEHLTDAVRGYGGSALGRAAPLVATALRASRAPFMLMLDDLHEVQNPACHDVLSVVITGIPPGSQLLTASRAEQPHLAHARAVGESIEITAGDLAFDASGAREVFADADLALSPEEALEVVERTEGWPVGVSLAAAIMRDGGTPTVSGDDRFIADYLYQEALMSLPEHQQRFLRRTAVLENLSAALCDAILGTDDAGMLLRELSASNSFLMPLDRRREWYRYHGLFREFLLAELTRTEPDLAPGLRVRAASWFEDRGTHAVAVEYLLDVPTERTKAIHLVAATTLDAYQLGLLTTVQRWYRTIGDRAIEEYPPLAVYAGWITALAGHPDEADRWAAVLAEASYDRPPDDGSASFDSARAMLRSFMCAGGPEQALADARYAVASEPSTSPWRDQALVILGEAQLLAGDVERAKASFAEGSVVAAAHDNTDGLVTAESELARLMMDDGQWVEGAGHVQTALEAIDAHGMDDYALSVLAFAEAARLALHQGDLQAVRRHVTRAMRARPACTSAMPYISVRARLQLAKLHWALNDHITAHHLLREIEDIVIRRPHLGALVDQVEEFRNLVASTERTGWTGGPPLSPAELRLLPYLQTHLSNAEIAARLYVSRNTVNSELASIYRKFNVSKRSEAVQRATEVGLLGA
ncbi:LuxR family transcriptional regulator [Agromyces sp. CFH 90414]|uniref:LuxR family transcriptional regulator n=1 Tax=Agromyces agglutinans TaxID=2662258 RepID=A0A6I2FFL2_9MICO|nr:LuxR family transcriptional regulator [Agromyces agglutinans]